MSLINIGSQKKKVLPEVALTNIKINVQLVGKIHWIQKAAAFTATADCPLPDGELMVMFEQVIDSKTVVNDTRFKAVVVDGVISISGSFDTTGNWMLTAKRVNRGLDRIGAQFHLSFDPIEFDVYA